MKWRNHFQLFAPAILGFILLGVPAVTRAQAPAGPLPAAAPQPASASTANAPNPPKAETRTSIFGKWKLNRDESDDARKKMEDAKANQAGRSSRGSGVSIAGFPIGGRGGYGGNRGGASEEEQQKTQAVVAPAMALTLAQKDAKDPEVDVTDDQNRKLALFTDGRKVQKPDAKDDSYEEIAAHWDGSRLVTDEKSPHGGKMSRTFELSYDGAELYETIRLMMGRSNTPVDLRYVYEPAPAGGEPPER
jgi:hypothetical protein